MPFPNLIEKILRLKQLVLSANVNASEARALSLATRAEFDDLMALLTNVEGWADTAALLGRVADLEDRLTFLEKLAIRSDPTDYTPENAEPESEPEPEPGEEPDEPEEPDPGDEPDPGTEPNPGDEPGEELNEPDPNSGTEQDNNP